MLFIARHSQYDDSFEAKKTVILVALHSEFFAIFFNPFKRTIFTQLVLGKFGD